MLTRYMLLVHLGKSEIPAPILVLQYDSSTITETLCLEQSVSSQRILRTARHSAPTAGFSMLDTYIVRHSRRSCFKFEQVDRLQLASGRLAVSHSETRPCEASTH